MFKHRKFAAFIMSLLICSAAFAPQAVSVYAHPGHEHEESSAPAAESSSEAEEEEEEEENNFITSGDYLYSAISQDSVCIEGYTGSDEKLVIPDEIDGMKVTKINRSAFETCMAESIHIPASVTYISAENPFLLCTNLEEITIDEDNEDYTSEDGILYSKDKKQILCYPQAKKGDSFAVPEGVEEIGIAAFCQTSLKEISFPKSVTTLDRHSVSSNPAITSIDLSGTSVDYIGDMAFSYCEALTEIKFPDTLLEIGGASFAGCTAMTEITFPDSLLAIGQNAFAATGLTEVTIPASVTDIGYCAFGYNENLEPNEDFTIIGAAGSAAQVYATDADADFGYANNFIFKTLEQAETENSLGDLESIPFGDFGYAEVDGEAYITACTSVDSVVEVPSSINGLPVTCIYGGAFFQNGATKIVLPDTLKTIETLAFYMCTNLTEITVPDGVTEIKDSAFDSCMSLESITIPGTCGTIGKEIFFGCTALEEITVSNAEGGNYCSEDGVLYSKDKSVLIAYPAAKPDKKFKAPSELREILQSAFSSCAYLEEADISTASVIGEYAFENCQALTRVKFAKDIEKIDAYAFYNCLSLMSVRLYNADEIGTAAIGFRYDTANSADILLEGFKIYADDDSDGHRYSQICGIECVTDTIDVFGLNVVKGFAYTVIGALAAAVLAIIGIIIGKSVKKKKAIKEEAEHKSILAQNADSKSDRKDNENEAE